MYVSCAKATRYRCQCQKSPLGSFRGINAPIFRSNRLTRQVSFNAVSKKTKFGSKNVEAVIGMSALLCVLAGPAQAETLPPELLGLLNSWLDALQDLGPLGPAAFVVTIGICECIPFFPTQPLSICAGLLFGAGSGAALNLLGLSIASTIAFTISRTVGRGLAEAVVKAETGGDGGSSKTEPNAIAARIAQAEEAIANGGPLQQFTAILLLRLTPIVPFSASNYVLGLSPVPYGPFIGATVAGMAVWSALLAGLGSAGRNLLTSGADLSAVLEQVSGGAGDITGEVVIFGVGLAVVVAIASQFSSFVPSPDDLGKPEAFAEAKRREGLRSSDMESQKQKELASVKNVRK